MYGKNYYVKKIWSYKLGAREILCEKIFGLESILSNNSILVGLTPGGEGSIAHPENIRVKMCLVSYSLTLEKHT